MMVRYVGFNRRVLDERLSHYLLRMFVQKRRPEEERHPDETVDSAIYSKPSDEWLV